MSWDWRFVEKERLVAKVTFEQVERPAYGAWAWREGLIYAQPEGGRLRWEVAEYEPCRYGHGKDPRKDTQWIAKGWAENLSQAQDDCEAAYLVQAEVKGNLYQPAEQEEAAP